VNFWYDTAKKWQYLVEYLRIYWTDSLQYFHRMTVLWLQMIDLDLVFTAQGYAKRSICRRHVSVCLSHSSIVSIKTPKHMITQTTQHDSSMNLVF